MIVEGIKKQSLDAQASSIHSKITQALGLPQLVSAYAKGAQHKMAAVFNAAGMAAEMMGTAQEAALATLTMIAAAIPGELEVNAKSDENDEMRTFEVFKGGVLCGTLISGAWGQKSGLIGGRLDLQIPQGVMKYITGVEDDWTPVGN